MLNVRSPLFFPTRWNNAQNDGAMQIEENVPAKRPIMMGNANIRISGTPIIATISIIKSVVMVVLIDLSKVSRIDLLAMP